MKLQIFSEGIWTYAHPHTMMGLHLGTRMTLVQLNEGKLFLHSPTPIDTELKKEIDELGTVCHIVCPNLFHHMYAQDAQKLWPTAMIHAPFELRKKRKDLLIHSDLSLVPHDDWKGFLRPHKIKGCMLHETVFLHEKSGSLLSVDLLENFHQCNHWPTRLYLQLNDVYQKPGWARILRPLFTNRKEARADIQTLLQWDFDKLLLAHGEPIHNSAKASIESGYHWLL